MASDNLGRCLAAIGNYEAAVAPLQKAVHDRPDDAAFHFHLARILSMVPGREREAVAQYEAVIRLVPNSAEAHHDLAELLVKLGHATDAASHFEAEKRLNADTGQAQPLI